MTCTIKVNSNSVVEWTIHVHELALYEDIFKNGVTQKKLCSLCQHTCTFTDNTSTLCNTFMLTPLTVTCMYTIRYIKQREQHSF